MKNKILDNHSSVSNSKPENMIINKEYRFSLIENFFEDTEFHIEEYGDDNAIGRSFLIFEHDYKDQRYAFILTGATNTQYIYKLIHKSTNE